MRNKQKGIACILISALSFGLMNIFVRLSGNIPSMQKSFFRNLIAMIVSLITIVKSGEGIHYKKEDLPYLLLRASFGTIGILGNFYAVDHMLVADASAIQKVNPFIVIIACHFILKEKVKPAQLGFILIAFLGCLLVVKPSVNMDLFPASVAGLGAIGAGLAYTMVRILSQRGVSKSGIVFFFSAFSTIVAIPFMIKDFTPMTTTQLFYLIMAGICASGGQFGVTYAYSYAPSKEISVFDYTQIIFVAIISFFVFNQVPDVLSIVGYIIIILAGYLNYRYNNRQLQKRRTRFYTLFNI